MRENDVIGDQERDVLKFDRFDGFSKPVYLPVFQTAGALDRAVSLGVECATAYRAQHSQNVEMRTRSLSYEAPPPGASVIAGPADEEGSPAATQARLFETVQADVALSEAVSEAFELLAWLLRRLLGDAHDADMSAIADALGAWAAEGELLQHVRIEQLQARFVVSHRPPRARWVSLRARRMGALAGFPTALVELGEGTPLGTTPWTADVCE